MGGLDVLIHGAAAYGFRPFAQSSPDLLLRVLETSLQSAILLTHAAIPALKLSDNAVVVQIASTAGLRPVTEAVVYSAAKAGMIAFGKALRPEVEGLGIALHTVIPGQLQLQPGGAGLPPAHVAQCIHELILQRAAGCAEASACGRAGVEASTRGPAVGAAAHSGWRQSFGRGR